MYWAADGLSPMSSVRVLFTHRSPTTILFAVVTIIVDSFNGRLSTAVELFMGDERVVYISFEV